jgi:hypothetical protein
MKRLAQTAHLHEVELEAQRRARMQAERTEGNSDTNHQDHETLSNRLASSMLDDSQHSDDHLASDTPGQPSDHHPTTPSRKDPPNTGMFGRRSPPPSTQQPDNGVEWEDTDADLDADDSMQELIVEENFPAPRIPRLYSPPTPRTWSARRKTRGFSADTGTALHMQCA